MAAHFKTIGIYGRVKNNGVLETLQALISFLKNEKQDFIIESETNEILAAPDVPQLPKEKLSLACDLLIVVGGDGSLLNAIHSIAQEHVPILGINRGRLGFLTDILPSELHKIKNILNGAYRIEKRFMINATITLDGASLGDGVALNEVAVIPPSMPHMTEFEIFVNEQFVCSQDSDGLIIATPTGSTAYALSGGGPILHPELDAMVLVPMFPHALGQRPIVINGNDRIKIIITPNNTSVPRVSCDNQTLINAPHGSHIDIEKKKEHLQLIHPLDYDYYATLRSKLHWGRKLQYAE